MEFTDKHVMGLKDLLYRMADDLLILGHRNSEWTGLGPILEEDIAFSSMAQDKIGQSLALYEILQELGENEPDVVAFMRNAEAFHSCQLVELPIGEYDFSLVRHFYFDHQSALRMDMLKDTVVEPLQMVARKFRGEIKYHTMHADTWMKMLGAGSEEGKARMQKAIMDCAGLALGMFELSEYETELSESGIFAGEEALKIQWIDSVSQKLEAFGFDVPDWDTVIPVYGGRKGAHTADLQPLLDEMTEVFRIDPAAEW
jgi:ring-1,2-phenylacetyl-CoA epoxidase subunit PaaC